MPLRPRVAVVHPVPTWHGGAEVVALWTIEALKHDHEVALLSYGSPPDFEELNRRFGTSIAAGELTWLRIPIPTWAFRFRGPFDIAWRYLSMLYCRRLSARFDLFVSTFYEMDFGRPGVQYCHCPMYAVSESPSKGARHPALRLLAWSSYRRLTGALTGFRSTRLRQNVTLANSDWTGRQLSQAYAAAVQTIYPPVQGAPRPLPFSQRENGFLCVGRLVPEKRFDAVIRILARVREQGGDVHLHLALSAPDPEYRRVIEKLAAAHGSWVQLEWDLSRADLLALIGAHKYGIHAREGEHFGLAPAEIAASGAIVFVHDSGGQVEIASDPRLRYSSESDAATKILAVVNDASGQAELRALLLERSLDFSAERFMAEMRGVVKKCLGQSDQPA
jgi:glycosyltransferase involved in cell wall biosynthesis